MSAWCFRNTRSFRISPRRRTWPTGSRTAASRGMPSQLESRNRSTSSRFGSSINATPTSCRAASSSASRWRAPSPIGRTCLLLDEPFSSLDAKLRVSLRTDLRQLQRTLGITTVFVTHDQQEALALSDRLAVMHAGCVEQIGTPEAIYESPSSAFVADFVGGTNLLRGTIEAVNGSGACRVNVSGAGTLVAAGAARRRRRHAGRPDDQARTAASVGRSSNRRPSRRGSDVGLLSRVRLQLRPERRRPASGSTAIGAGPRRRTAARMPAIG